MTHMDTAAAVTTSEKFWDVRRPALPCTTTSGSRACRPASRPNWAELGHIAAAVDLLRGWAADRPIDGSDRRGRPSSTGARR